MSRRKKGGSSIGERQFWESGRDNNATFIQYYNRLTELAISMFEWKNLPSTIDPRYLELALYTDGDAVFFFDEDLGENGSYLALRVAAGGPLDVYSVPMNRRAYAANGYNKQLGANDSVLIYNNFLRTNSMLDTRMFAQRLYELDRAIDVNAKAQKTPILIRCGENERLTMQQLYMKYDGNQPFIFATKDMNPNGFGVLKTDAPYVADRLYTLKTQIWNEALTYLGISNINVTKKERLITDEVQRNQGGTLASRYSRLEMRKQACKQINEKFGLNIDVEYRDDLRTEAELNNEGGNEDE